MTLEQHDRVAVINLSRAATNPINLELVGELTRHLARIRENPELRAVVLGGANDKFFSIGFDIPELFPLDRQGFVTFYRAFNRLSMALYTFPKPTVAAITGHAIAGGCILAVCCDHRLIAEGKKLMGLNEIKLGVSIPYPAACILQALVGARHAQAIMERGEFHPPAESLRIGMVDEVLPLAEVRSRAIARAAELGDCPAAAWWQIKRNRQEEVVARIEAHLAEQEEAFLDSWFSDEARARLLTAMEKF